MILLKVKGQDGHPGPTGPAGAGIKTGTVAYFAASSIPTEWLECNGAAISRATYSDLFAVIGTTHGAGNGYTTFNIPDLRGEFIRGHDNGRGVDSGRWFGSAQTDAFQSHIHSGSYFKNGSSFQINTVAYALHTVGDIGSPSTDGAYGTPRTASETRPRNIALAPCIKY